MSSGSGGPFRIVYSGLVLTQVRDRSLTARRLGLGLEFLADLRTIQERLTNEPL